MNERAFDTVKKVVPFAPAKDRAADAESGTVDRSGQAIVGLLQQAAGAAKENCERAMDVAHKLSMQLSAAEDRIKELENDIHHYHDRALRSERWLARIYKEIEEKFFDPQVAERERQEARR